jgi:hypothetical protein
MKFFDKVYMNLASPCIDMIEDEQIGEDFTIRQLYERELISKWTHDFCRQHGLVRLSDIMNQIKPGSREVRLRKCGAKTNAQLIALYQRFRYATINTTLEKPVTYKMVELNGLSPQHTRILIDEVDAWVAELSTRAYRTFLRVMDPHNKVGMFYTILDTSVNYLHVRNIGLKTAMEIAELQNRTLTLLNKLLAEQD